MIATFVTCLLFAVIAGIFLRSAIHAFLLVAFVCGVFVLSCYACRVSPRAVLSDGSRGARHELKLHRREIERPLRELL
jgi:hypothetical protein